MNEENTEKMKMNLQHYLKLHLLPNFFGSLFLVSLLIITDLSFLMTSLIYQIGISIIIGTNLFRLFLYYLNSSKKILYNSSILSAIGWMLAVYAVGSTKGYYDLHTIISIVLLSGVSSSGSLSNAYNPYLSAVYLIFSMFIPSVYMYFWNPHSPLISLVGLAYGSYLLRFCSQYRKQICSLEEYKIELELSRHTFTNMFDAIPGIVSLIGRDLTYKVINKKLLDSIGLKLEEIIGQPIGFQNPNGDFTKIIYKYAESRMQVPLYIRIQISPNKDEPQWYLLSINRIPQTQDILCLSLDINEQVKLEKENESQKESLIQSSKMVELGQLSSSIAHELNNPITILKGKTSQLRKLLQQPQLEKEKMSLLLSAIDKTTERIAKIIQSILSFSRKSTKEPFEATNLHELITETLEFASIKAKNNDVSIIYEKPALDVTLDCRPVEISQVILNLISNAIDAISQIPDRWVKIDYLIIDKNIQLRVINSGPKISQELSKKIMQPFFTTKESGRGTGLGLTISNHIIQSYKGILFIDEKSNQTCFVIEVPLKQSALQKAS